MNNNKFLPIKIFEKRKDYDERSTEGRRNSVEPSWVLHGEELSAHAEYLYEEIGEIKDAFAKHEADHRMFPMVISTTIHKDALAKTHRNKITSVLEVDGHDNVVGMNGKDKILSLVENKSVLDSMERIFSEKENAVVISSISEMEPYQPYIEPIETENQSYRVRLIDYNDFDRNSLVKVLFEQYCQENGIEVNARVRFTSDMTIYRVTVASADMLGELREFEGLYSAEITHPIYTTTDSTAADLKITKKEPDDYEDYPIIGVLDTGIEDIPYLEAWKTDEKFESYPKVYTETL